MKQGTTQTDPEIVMAATTSERLCAASACRMKRWPMSPPVWCSFSAARSRSSAANAAPGDGGTGGAAGNTSVWPEASGGTVAVG